MKKLLEKYLWFLGRAMLVYFQPEIILVTGTAGKTSTKEMIFSVLSESKKFQGDIGKSFGNLNTKTGVPLAIFQIKIYEPNVRDWFFLVLYLPIKFLFFWLHILHYPKWLVLEIGADKKGDIRAMVKILKPRVGVVTNIGAGHLEFFQNVEKLTEEKLSIFDFMGPDDLAVLPQKGLRRARLDKIRAKKRFFDLADLTASSRIIGDFFHLSGQEIEKGLKNTKKAPNRMAVLENGGMTIINDTYNANPVSIKASLEFLDAVVKEKKSKRKIVVLADMLELGKNSVSLHKKMGSVVRKKADLFFTLGDYATYYNAKQHFHSKEKLLEALLWEIREGDIILVKGSRGMKMEEVVEGIIKSLKSKV